MDATGDKINTRQTKDYIFKSKVPVGDHAYHAKSSRGTLDLLFCSSNLGVVDLFHHKASAVHSSLAIQGFVYLPW